jgi:hypothetical protein
MRQNDMVEGSVVGTGAAINVSIGFKPRKVVLFQLDTPAKIEWTEDMGAGKGVKTTGTPAFTALSSNGITLLSGTTTYSDGFTIGADTDINVDTETIYYVAFR